MEIKYDNLTNPSNYITFTDIPNILSVTDDGYGTKAVVTLTVLSGLKGSTTSDYQWKVTFMGETISNVLQPRNAINKYFAVMTSTNDTATSMARAFRNCPTISANFIVQSSGATVTLTAKNEGYIFEDGISNNLSTTIPSNLLTLSAVDGTTYSDLYNAKIDVEVYNDEEYVTMLEKNFYNGECSFNLSPVLTTFARHGYSEPYSLKLYSYKNGVQTNIGNIDTNYISVGYMVNQGMKYLDNSIMNIAQNISRGSERSGLENNTILYVYGNSIPISFYRGNNGRMTITTEYLDSAYNVVKTESFVWQSTTSSKMLIDLEVVLSSNIMNEVFYVDISLGSSYKIRYNVIKPLLATEYYQRVSFRNSYGGVSFFDFSGQKTENRKLTTSTYEKNIFDYYTDDMNELTKIYDNDVDYSVTLKSHLFEENGKFIFNDILQSSEVWTTINGEEYAIIIDSVSVDESNNNGIYEATLTYHYSQKPSLI